MLATWVAWLLVTGSGQSCDPAVALRRPSLMGLTPLRSPFSSVDRMLKAPARRLRQAADGEVAPVIVCLKSKEDGGEAFVLVESSAAGGYGSNVVTGLRLSISPPAGLRPLAQELQPAHARSEVCVATRSFGRATAFSNGLRLGMTREQVRALLGSPTGSAGRTWRYLDDRRSVPGDCPRGSADYAELTVTFGQEGAVEIRVEQSDMR